MGHFYFVRHGETGWNIENKICGATDIELTRLGHEQAEEAAQRIVQSGIRFDEILCSPLIRARQTAEPIARATGKTIRIEPRLREQNFGRFEAAQRGTPEFMQSKERFADRYGNGESLLLLGQRIYNLIDDIKADPSGKTYLLVSHNGVARMVHTYFHDMDNKTYASFGIRNCEVVEYSWD